MLNISSAQIEKLAEANIMNGLDDLITHFKGIITHNIVVYEETECKLEDYIKNKAKEAVGMKVLTKQGVAKFIYIYIIKKQLCCKPEWLDEMNTLIRNSESQNQKIELMDRLIFTLSNL